VWAQIAERFVGSSISDPRRQLIILDHTEKRLDLPGIRGKITAISMFFPLRPTRNPYVFERPS
jgi:hypothetical protein